MDPWKCSNSICGLEGANGGSHLTIEERKDEHSGPWQLLNVSYFQDPSQLKLSFNYSLLPSAKVEANWKVRVTTGAGQVKYYSIMSQQIEEGSWSKGFRFLTFPAQALGAQELKLYLEVKPNVNFGLDDVVLEQVDDGHWEEEANQRIDILRKRDLSMVITGSVGEEDWKLEVVHENHSFPFGTAVQSPRIASCWDSGEDDAYCLFVKENFNWLVDTYRMKWKPMEPEQGHTDTVIPDKMIGWATANGKTVRGHALLWAKEHNNPAWVQDLYGEEMVAAINNRVTFAVQHFDGQVPHWDVINEMVDQGFESHTFYMNHTGDPLIRVKTFQLAKSLSPNTLFFVNDYGIILDKYGRFSMFQQQVRDLLAGGAPIDALGLQSHIGGSDMVDVVQIKYHVDQLWQEFHLPIWVTEFDWNAHNDVDMGDHSFHAQQLENFYRLMFSHEAVQGILCWNLNIIEAETSEPNKAGLEYIRLVHQEWSSSQLLEPNSETGSLNFKFRGFLGDYRLRLLRGNMVLGEVLTTLKEDTNLVCQLGEDMHLVC